MKSRDLIYKNYIFPDTISYAGTINKPRKFTASIISSVGTDGILDFLFKFKIYYVILKFLIAKSFYLFLSP